MSSKLRSTTAALALILVTGTAAQALPFSGPAFRGEESFLENAWEWVASLLPNDSRSGRHGKAGGMMDPNSLSVGDNTAGCQTDEGGMMDPNGLR